MAKAITIQKIKEVFEAALDKETGLMTGTNNLRELIMSSQFVVEVEEFGTKTLTAFSDFDEAERFIEEVKERNDVAQTRLYDLNQSWMTVAGEMFLETAY